MTSATGNRAVPGGGPQDEEESRKERNTRKWNEMLQELRVAQTGVQVLTGFLLTVPFSQRFGDLTAFQIDVYYVTLLATLLSTTCFITPSASHRLRFHQNDRPWIVESANVMTIAGLCFLAVALGGSVLLITDVLFDGPRVWIYTAAIAIVIVALWFVRPLLRYRRR